MTVVMVIWSGHDLYCDSYMTVVVAMVAQGLTQSIPCDIFMTFLSVVRQGLT